MSSRKPARLEMTPEMADVFAAKDEPPSPASERAEPRSAPVTATLAQPMPASSQQASKAPARRTAPAPAEHPPVPPRGVATTIAIPAEVMDRIRERLRQDQGHNMRSLVLYALSQIGIEVEPEHLKPTRRRWSR